MSRLPARRARFQRRVIDRRALHRGAEWFPARAESRGAELYARSKLAYKLIEHLSTWFRRPRAAAAPQGLSVYGVGKGHANASRPLVHSDSVVDCFGAFPPLPAPAQFLHAGIEPSPQQGPQRRAVRVADFGRDLFDARVAGLQEVDGALDAQALEVVERRSSEHVVHAPRERAFARARRSRCVVRGEAVP